jgi:ABC-type nitrate/sulfonate/bicarbonate transport system substrate-binding protein
MDIKTISAAFGVLAFAISSAAAAEDIPSLRYAIGSEDIHSLSQLPTEVAQRKKFFDREGVHVEFVRNSASNSRAAEQGYNPSIERGGPADMTRVSTGYFIHSVLRGSDTVIVATQTNNPIYSIIATPEIKAFADLKGKAIALTSPWDTITLASRKLLALHGLGAHDFQVVGAIRGSDSRFACMRSGECVANSAGQPADIHAIEGGYHRLGITNEIGPVIYNVEIVRRDWAQAHKDTVVRYIRAVADAMRFINDQNNRAEVETIASELTREPEGAVKEMIAAYYDPKLHVLPRQGEVDMASFEYLLQILQESGVYDRPLPPAEHFVDLSYAKAAGAQ